MFTTACGVEGATNRSETRCDLALDRQEGWKNQEQNLLVWGSLSQLPQKETQFSWC